jgi:hypothetical protein
LFCFFARDVAFKIWPIIYRGETGRGGGWVTCCWSGCLSYPWDIDWLPPVRRREEKKGKNLDVSARFRRFWKNSKNQKFHFFFHVISSTLFPRGGRQAVMITAFWKHVPCIKHHPSLE